MTLVICDIGNVVIKADHEIAYRRLRELGVEEGRERSFFDNGHYREFSRRDIDGQAFYEALVQRYLGCRPTFENVVDAHNRHMHAVDEDVLQILTQLNKDDLIFLTDTNEWQTARERELIDLSQYSDAIYRSDKLRKLKSDPGFFPYFMDRLGHQPEECLLIDDNTQIISVAHNAGLQTMLFEGAQQLRQALQQKDFL